MKPADLIKATDLGFTYELPRHSAFSLKEFASKLHRREVPRNVKVLEGVNFNVRPGEVLAVIGKNGSGKSTLLKILAKVLPPSQGKVIINGTIAPMIELGAGFHPELNGFENTVLYSAILGRDVKEAKERVHLIAEWAGLTDYMHLPIRAFSSGMVARLAFAISTDVAPGILLVDEVLSVGDAEFQMKSRERMDQVMEQNTAVVLVTHDLVTASTLATRALFLSHDSPAIFGDATDVIKEYKRRIGLE
jgi:ABC-type polysaccharide/polyol phosphate transport system ATPase subunit